MPCSWCALNHDRLRRRDLAQRKAHVQIHPSFGAELQVGRVAPRCFQHDGGPSRARLCLRTKHGDQGCQGLRAELVKQQDIRAGNYRNS